MLWTIQPWGTFSTRELIPVVILFLIKTQCIYRQYQSWFSSIHLFLPTMHVLYCWVDRGSMEREAYLTFHPCPVMGIEPQTDGFCILVVHLYDWGESIIWITFFVEYARYSVEPRRHILVMTVSSGKLSVPTDIKLVSRKHISSDPVVPKQQVYL